MKAKVNKEICIGCGVCVLICPEVFQIKDDGLAHVIVGIIPEKFKSSTIETEKTCFVGAISHEN